MAVFPFRVDSVPGVQVPHAGPRHAVRKAKEVFRSTSRKCLEQAESEWEFTQGGVQTSKTAVDT